MTQHAFAVPTGLKDYEAAAAEVQPSAACADVDTAFCMRTTGMYMCK